YFEVMQRASQDASINFRLHTIELYDSSLDSVEAAPSMVAGEIGYSVGRVYTSLSGFSLRDADGVGWIQLACLGKWLEHHGYAFWSLGHCYSPQMEYKRQLGHRIFTRAEFLERLKEQRGPFRGKSDFAPLADGAAFELEAAQPLRDKEP
ncbi:unnamed protein product, partial [Polarella glacialis]